MGKFPARWGGISPWSLEGALAIGHCETKSSREACEVQCIDTAHQGAWMFISSWVPFVDFGTVPIADDYQLQVQSFFELTCVTTSSSWYPDFKPPSPKRQGVDVPAMYW
jgi:hypothetical protein